MNLNKMIRSNARLAIKSKHGDAIVILFITILVELLFTTISSIISYILNINIPIDIYNTPPVFIDNIPDISVLSIIFNLLCLIAYIMIKLPLFIGIKYWYFSLVDENPKDILSIFSFFSDFRSFSRSIRISVNIAIRCTCWAIVLFVVPFTSLLAGIITINLYSDLSVLGFVLILCSLGFFLMSSVLLLIISQKYFLAKYFLVADNLSVGKAISKSIKYTSLYKTKIFLFRLSFLGFYLINIFIIPMLFTIPYISTCNAMYAKYLICLRSREFDDLSVFQNRCEACLLLCEDNSVASSAPLTYPDNSDIISLSKDLGN